MDITEQILHKEIKENRTPSIQYYLFDENHTISKFQSGFSDIAGRIPVDDHTTYNAFSVTKTFTALGVLQLAERGNIDIQKPIYLYLPDFIYGKEITIQQILSHSSGIPNPIPLSWIHRTDENHNFDRNTFFNTVLHKNSKVKFKPNKRFMYSNLGYFILGQLIEKVSGQTYEAYITENIIRKSGLNADDLSFTIAHPEKQAKGYHKRHSFSGFILGCFIDKSKFKNKNEGKWWSFNNFYVNGASYGGLIGRPTAFVKYIQELLKTDSPLITQEYKQKLFQENRNAQNKNTGMCMSWFSGNLNGEKYVAHAGGGGSYYCEIRIYPQLKLGSVIFFNRSGMSDERFLDKADGQILQKCSIFKLS